MFCVNNFIRKPNKNSCFCLLAAIEQICLIEPFLNIIKYSFDKSIENHSRNGILCLMTPQVLSNQKKNKIEFIVNEAKKKIEFFFPVNLMHRYTI